MLTDVEKIDILWKRNLNKTSTSLYKDETNETILSLNPVLLSNVWNDEKLIPIIPPTNSTNTVEVITIPCVMDETVISGGTWLTEKTGWISPLFGENYAIKVFVNDIAKTQLYSHANNYEWVFDYNSGVLRFLNNVPSSVITNGIKISGYHYTGQKGLNLISRFTELQDTPNTFYKQSEKILRVKSDESGIEFVSLDTSNISISNDISPSLGGDLNITGHKLFTTDNKDIRIMASGNLIMQGLVYPNVGGTAGQVLSIQSGQLVWTNKLSSLLNDSSPTLSANLNVNGNSIYSDSKMNIYTNSMGSLQLEGFTWPKLDGNSNQVLSTDGSKTLIWKDIPRFDGHLQDDLIVDDYKITTTSNKSINIIPNGTGNIILGKLTWPKIIGNINQILSSDGNGNLIWNTNDRIKSLLEDFNPTLSANLNVNGNSIYSDSKMNIYTNSMGSLQLEGFTWPKLDGTNGQVLTTDGSKTLTWKDLSTFKQSFTLTEDLITNNYKITTTSNKSINIIPNGTGNIILDKLAWPKTIGNANQILSSDGNGNLIWINITHSLIEDSSPTLSVNLNVNGKSIYSDSKMNIYTNSMGSLQLEGFTWPKLDGTNGQVLSTDGSKILTWKDLPTFKQSFTLTENLITDNYKITTTSNKSINIIPNGTGNIILDKLTWPKTIGNANQILSSDGNGNLIWNTNDKIKSLSDDMFPKLSGDLDVSGFKLTSTNDINLSPSGIVILKTLKYPGQDGNAGQVLTTDGSKNLYWSDADIFTKHLPSKILSKVLDDTSPKLGGDLDVSGFKLTSTGDIILLPAKNNTLIFNNIRMPCNDGNVGQILTTDGNGTLYWASLPNEIFLSKLEDDTSPKLGGDLNVSNHKIISSTDLDISANNIILNGVVWPKIGNANQILSIDQDKNLVWTTISDSITNNLDIGTYSIISSVGDINIQPTKNLILSGFTFPLIDGEQGAFLSTDGNKNFTWGSFNTAPIHLINDLNPTLGGDLNLGNYSITSNTEVNIIGKIILNGLKWPKSDGNSNQFLSTDGNGNLIWVSAQIDSSLVNDINPTLGGDLNVKSYSIISDGDINLQPTKNLILSGFTFPSIDGEQGAYLSTDGNKTFMWNSFNTAPIHLINDLNPTLGGDLDLGNYSIISKNEVNILGKISLNGLKWPKSDGNSNQILSTDGNGNLIWSSTQIGGNLINDLNPTLGGDLNVGSYYIISDGNINIQPTKNLILSGFMFPSIDGEPGAYLSTDGNKAFTWGSFNTAPIRLINDLNPTLGGDLDIGNNLIFSKSDVNISAISGNIILDGLKWPKFDGNSGQTLFTDGNGNLFWASVLTDTGTISLVNDSNPTLGGNLNVNNFKIVAPLDKDIIFETTGRIILNDIIWPSGDSAQKQILTTNGNGLLVWESRLETISQDTFPSLGGNLDTQGYMIHSLDDLVLHSNKNIILNNQKWPIADGNDGQFLTTDGNGNLFWKNPNYPTVLLTDLNPTLGGNLNVGDYSIISNNVDLKLVINGDGNLILNGIKWANNESIAAAGAVLTYDGDKSSYWDNNILRNIVQDSYPELGGNLILNDYRITNTFNKNIILSTTGNGDIILNGLTIPKDVGNNGDVLTSFGNGNLYWKSIDNFILFSDKSPKLGGNLNVGNHSIVSDTNILINANHKLFIQGLEWPSGGNANDVLRLGVNNLYWSSTAFDLSSDKNPVIGGNLILSDFSITNSIGRNVIIKSDAAHLNTRIVLDGQYWPRNIGKEGRVLTTNSSGILSWEVVLKNLSEDTNPQLGGHLVVNDYHITSINNGNVYIRPTGRGNIDLDHMLWPKYDGQNGWTLYTEGNGQLYWGPPLETLPPPDPNVKLRTDVKDHFILTANDILSKSIELNHSAFDKSTIVTNDAGKFFNEDVDYTVSTNITTGISVINFISSDLLSLNVGDHLHVMYQTYDGFIPPNGALPLLNVHGDTSPRLGGDLDTNGFKIISSEMNDLEIQSGSGGHLIIDGSIWPSQGQPGQVLSTDGVNTLSWISVSDKLHDPSDGSITDSKTGVTHPDQPNLPPAITNWVLNQTSYTDAIDDLNTLLGKLLPPPPPALNTKNLSMLNGVMSVGGSNILLAQSCPDNTGDSVVNGINIIRVLSNQFSTNTVIGFGNGSKGYLKSYINGLIDGNIILVGDDATGRIDKSLTIVKNYGYPTENKQFHLALDANINPNSLEIGVNKYKMQHSLTGDTNEIVFCVDDGLLLPIVDMVAISELNGNIVYSSGVPHYGNNSVVGVSISVLHLSTRVYLENNNIIINGTGFGNRVSLSCGDYTIPTILPQNMSSLLVDDVPFIISGNCIKTDNISVYGRNANGNGSPRLSDKSINIMSGILNVGFDYSIIETNVYVDLNLGSLINGAPLNASRIQMTETDDVSNLLISSWDSTTALASYEASVVGGIISFDKNNYVYYLPSGPDYTLNRDDNQYITFFFRRSSVSNFNISVNGTYSGLWVKCYFNDEQPNCINGWMDMYKLADPVGYPGSVGNSDGCAFGVVANGNSGTFKCTFGAQSSTFSKHNIILVRFKLTDGQKITNLAFMK